MYNPYSPTLPAINNIPNTTASSGSAITEPLEKTIVDPWQGGFPAEPREVRDWLAENMEKAHTLTDYELSVELEEQLGKEVWLNTVTCARKDMGITYKYPNNTHGLSQEGEVALRKSTIRSAIQAWLVNDVKRAASHSCVALKKMMEAELKLDIPIHTVTYYRDRLGIRPDMPTIYVNRRIPFIEADKIKKWMLAHPDLVAATVPKELPAIILKGTGLERSVSSISKLRASLGIQPTHPSQHGKHSSAEPQRLFADWLKAQPKQAMLVTTVLDCLRRYMLETGRIIPRSTASAVKTSLGLGAPKGKKPGSHKPVSAPTDAKTADEHKFHAEILQQNRQMFRILARNVIDLRLELGVKVDEELAALAK